MAVFFSAISFYNFSRSAPEMRCGLVYGQLFEAVATRSPPLIFLIQLRQIMPLN